MAFTAQGTEGSTRLPSRTPPARNMRRGLLHPPHERSLPIQQPQEIGGRVHNHAAYVVRQERLDR